MKELKKINTKHKVWLTFPHARWGGVIVDVIFVKERYVLVKSAQLLDISIKYD
jgi:hypothetical protein